MNQTQITQKTEPLSDENKAEIQKWCLKNHGADISVQAKIWKEKFNCSDTGIQKTILELILSASSPE